MSNEFFSDFIGDISTTGSTVRIDLMSLSLTERDEEGKAVPVLRKRVIMPLEGFVRSHEMMQRMIDALVQAGTLQRNRSDQRDISAPPAEHPVVSSPNFPTAR